MTKRRGIPSLTGIRGVAAVWVMLFHMQQRAGEYFHLPGLERVPIIGYGWRGVDLFFILSGFVLMFAHERDFLQIRKDNLFRFAKLRFTRVYPLNTAVLLLIAGFIAFQPNFVVWYRSIHNSHDFTLIPFFKTLFLATRWYLPGQGDWNEPVWSLSLEILGYIAFPLLAHYAARARRVSQAIAVILVSYVLYLLALASAHAIYLNAIAKVSICRMLFGFIIGITIYRLWVITEGFAEKWATAISVVSVLGILGMSLVPQAGLLMELAFAALVYSLAFQRGLVDRVLASPPVLFLGKISFPLYLVHAIPMAWVHYQAAQYAGGWSLQETVMILAAWFAGSILLATALHYLVERPVHQLGRRWANQGIAAKASVPVSS